MRHNIYRLLAMAFFCLAGALPTVAQTTVTTSGGTTNSIPKFTGSSTVGDSVITESSGNVGIGTTNPGRSFHIKTASPVIRLEDTAVSSSYWELQQSAFYNDYFGIVRYESGSAVPAKSLVLSNSGYVGIGTTNPVAPLHVSGLAHVDGIWFNNGTIQSTASFGTITGVLPGSGLTGGGYSGNVSLAVDSSVARTNASQSFTGNQTIYGNVALGIINGSGGGFTANGGAVISNNYGGIHAPLSLYCTYVYNGPCWTIDQYGNSATTGNFYAGSLSVSGVKQFTIDHPLDPANKYLNHASIESFEIKNLYDGIAVLDPAGEAWVSLPSWFQALNRDYRYQLTAIGAPAPGLYVASEIDSNQFRIAGGQPNMKVSWTVTGIRQDAYAKARPLQVEVDKPDGEKGLYIDATVYGLPTSLSLPLPPARAKKD